MPSDAGIPKETAAMLQNHGGGTPPSADHIRGVFHTYCECLTSGNVDGIIELFDKAATFVDPAGSPPRKGHAEIRKFFEDTTDGVDLQLAENVRISGFVGAASMISHATKIDPPLRVETLDVITFNEAGKIIDFLAVWGESNITPL